MLRVVLSLLSVLASVAAQAEPAALARALGDDPAVVLRALGWAGGTKAARALAERTTAKLGSRQLLQLIRFGLGHADERVVFGAAILNPGALPVPELRAAAKRTIPRFGDRDCPVDLGAIVALCGSVDVPAIIARIPHLDADVAERWLGEVHRLVRPEHVPALCELALRAEGDVACGAFEDAWFAAHYGGEHAPLVITTWLQLVGGTPDPDGEGLPGVLAAALGWLLDNPPPAQPKAGEEPGPRMPRRPTALCLRWLLASRAGAKDLPLLLRIVDDGEQCVALRMLGTLTDEISAARLREVVAEVAANDIAEMHLHSGKVAARMALAMRGDAVALETLLAAADYGESLACGLHVASAAQRDAFARGLLASPPADALAKLRQVANLVAETFSPHVPVFDDAWFATLEPLAATAKKLDARVLRGLIAAVPSCATTRLADALLARPANEVFAPGTDEKPQVSFSFPSLVRFPFAPFVGFQGTWAFLEVTRPAVLRTRLREGLTANVPAVRDLCADLLLRLGDEPSAPQLLAWVQARGDAATSEQWLGLAQCGGAAVRAAIWAKAEALDDRTRRPLVPACALLAGFPVRVAERFGHDRDPIPWSQLRGDAASAFLAKLDESSWTIGDVLTWPNAVVQDRARAWAATVDSKPDDVARLQLVVGLLGGAADASDALRTMTNDGRYAVHHSMPRVLLTRNRDPATIAFWLREMGTNCCRGVVAGEALSDLFGTDPGNTHEDDISSVGMRLLSTLAPRMSRLRWSRLVNGFVVAGS
jgi:hypothetical protein